MAFREGKQIAASLEHVVYYPSKPADQYSTIIALHGRGTDELDLIPLVLSIGMKDLLVISPRAPRPFDLGVGFAWYDLSEEWVPRPQTFRTSLELLRRFFAEIKEGYPLNPKRIVLLGFSQGAVMAYAAALTDPAMFCGVVALSGYIPQRSGLSFDLSMLRGFSAFVSHGTYDEIIPVQLGRESAEFLKKVGTSVEYKEYSMGHEVREETIRDLAAWTKQRLES